MATLNFSPYLPDGCRERLRSYVYRSEDRSLIYRFFWRPLCRASVEKLPVWLAPNVITVTALLFVVFVHASLVYWMPNITVEPNVSPDALALVPLETQLAGIKYGEPLASDNYLRLSTVAQAPPSWIFAVGGLCLILYQYLDNLDGHQARRTGTSSPLGLLMDHGCDALNTVIGTLSIASVVCAGPTWKTWCVVSSGVIVFFCNTWEEYYRGSLVLPLINGANEGILVAASVYIVTAFTGPVFWLQVVSIPVASLPSGLIGWMRATHVQFDGRSQSLMELATNPSSTAAAGGDDPRSIGIMLNTLLIAFLIVTSIVTVAGNFYQVFAAVRRNEEGHGKYGSGWLLQRAPFLHALSRLLPLAVMTLFANVWMYSSPVNIFRAHPRIACWTFGLLYTKLAIHLMIAHLCSVEFHPLRRTLIPFLYCGLHAIATIYTRHGTLRALFAADAAAGTASSSMPFWGDEQMLLIEFFVISAVTFAHLALNVVIEMATELGVPVFTVPERLQRAASEKLKAS